MQAEGMTPAEKYLFDIHGYVIIEELLSAAEVEAANAAVNAHADEINLRPNDLSRGSLPLAGSAGSSFGGDTGFCCVAAPPYAGDFQLTELHVLNAYPRFLGEIYRWVYGV